MRVLLSPFLLLLLSPLMAQESVPELKGAGDKGREKLRQVQAPMRGPALMTDTGTAYLRVERMPEFRKGGEKGLKAYFEREVRMPQQAIDARLHGGVRIAFAVDEKGYIKETRIRRGLGMGCDEEAIRVVEAMPRWKPGRQDGKPVRVWVEREIRFDAKH